jgi:hypothetical protein
MRGRGEAECVMSTTILAYRQISYLKETLEEVSITEIRGGNSGYHPAILRLAYQSGTLGNLHRHMESGVRYDDMLSFSRLAGIKWVIKLGSFQKYPKVLYPHTVNL